MEFKLTKELASKVLETIDAGLVTGMGKPTPGQMCVEAAVCYAMGLPHSDQPTCVSPALRSLKIALNDSSWSTNEARTKGLRRLGVAQLGSKDALDDAAFSKAVSTLVIQKYVPVALLAAASVQKKAAHKEKLEKAALLCSTDPSEVAAISARAAAPYATGAAAYASYAAASAASAASYAWNAAQLSKRDSVLAEFGEDVVQILIKMNAPGCDFLYLTETN